MGFGSVEKPMLVRECRLKKNNKLLYGTFYHFLIKSFFRNKIILKVKL